MTDKKITAILAGVIVTPFVLFFLCGVFHVATTTPEEKCQEEFSTDIEGLQQCHLSIALKTYDSLQADKEAKIKSITN